MSYGVPGRQEPDPETVTGRVLPFLRPGLVWWTVSAACLLGTFVLSITRSLPAAVAAILCVLATALGLFRSGMLLVSLFVWLPLLGFVRRLPPLTVDAAEINPLLLVGPVATLVLLFVSSRAGVGRLTRLAAAVLAFNILILLSGFNPLQGDLRVGLAGVGLILPGVLWFWIGRALTRPRLLNRLLRVIALAGVVTALYGLWQTLIGFPSWDQTWISEKGYAALNVRGTTRPFSTFSSGAEYAAFAGVGIIILWSMKKDALKWQVRLAASAILGAALFLIATRGVLVLTVLALAVILAAKRGIGPMKAGGLIGITVVLLSLSLQLLSRIEFQNPQIASLVKHQLGGIGNPLDPEESTLEIHGEMVVSGLREMIRHPLGHGAGAVSIAGWKLGGKTMDTEVDFSNAAVGMGLPGFLLFTYIAVAGSLLAYRTAQKERSFLSLAAVGILVVTALHWLTGGQYAVAPLPWLFLGWLDRRASEAPGALDRDQKKTESRVKSEKADKPQAQPGYHRGAPDRIGRGADRDDGDKSALPPKRELQPLGLWASASRVASRLIDLSVASVSLVLLSPLLALLALMIRWSTGSSGFFTQVRLGKGGRPFRLIKLRTLLPEAPSQVPKREAQQMATVLGSWLRATKLDEAPQLWNVIKGQMALVGPRPIIPEEYSERSHYQRLKVRPGLTGLWQLSTQRGHPFDENPEYDLFYLENRSLAFDLWIMWRTLLLLVLGRETEMELAASLWEKSSSWRQAVPRAAHGVPRRAPTWRPALTVLLVACVAAPLTLVRRARLTDGMAGDEVISSLVNVLAKEGPRLLAWTLGVYVAATFIFFVMPVLLSRRPGLLRKVAWSAGLGFGVLLILAVSPVVSARGHLQQSRAALLDVTQNQQAIDLAKIESDLDSARLLALTARTELESPLTFGARLIPVVRGNIQAAHNLASAVSMIIPAINQSLAAAQTLSSPAAGQPGIFHRGRLDVVKLEQLSTPLAAAATTARAAVAQAEKESGLLLPPVRKAVTDFTSTGGRLAKALDMGAEGATLLPAMMGSQNPRTYFLMIQNGAEQRATGGYLGAFAILNADKGQLTLDQFQANSALPKGEFASAPSQEFADRYDRFESRGAWHNVNMTPDFPTASRMIAELWQRRTRQSIDGVLAIDAVALSELLNVSGPVSVPELPEQITSENFVRMALHEAYVRFPDKSARVDFLLPIGAQVWAKLLAGEGLDSRALMQAFGRSFATKHMQLWTRHEERTLNRLGIDGSLRRPRNRDYLLVVGQNAAGNKVDLYAKRRISYKVNIGRDGTTSARAEVLLENQAPSSGLPNYILGPFGNLPDPPGLNRSYLSLYVPRVAGISEAKVNGNPVGLESHSERGLGVVSRYVETPSGTSSRFQMALRSKLWRNGEYRLVLQHQPGLEPDSALVSVKVPEGTVVTGLSPGMRLAGGRVVWRGLLTADKEFHVRFSSSITDRLRSFLLRPLLVVL